MDNYQQLTMMKGYVIKDIEDKLNERGHGVINPFRTITYQEIYEDCSRLIDLIDVKNRRFGFYDPVTGPFVWLSLDNLSMDHLALILDEVILQKYTVEE